MRTDDPSIIKQIDLMQTALDALRRCCGIPDPRDPETELTKAPGYHCPHCSRMTRTRNDLKLHLRIDHHVPADELVELDNGALIAGLPRE